ncbi:hypothetical protein ABBQ38_009894 [Trebouxia sp. C0009 RCD-2024]
MSHSSTLYTRANTKHCDILSGSIILMEEKRVLVGVVQPIQDLDMGLLVGCKHMQVYECARCMSRCGATKAIVSNAQVLQHVTDLTSFFCFCWPQASVLVTDVKDY